MIHGLFSVPVYMSKDESHISLCEDLFVQAGPHFDQSSANFDTTLAQYSPGTGQVSWNPLELPKVQPFLEFIKAQVMQFLAEGGYSTDYTIEVANLWFNKMRTGSRHPEHTHYGYSLSGTYYITTPGDSAKIMLHSIYDAVSHQKIEVKEYKPFNSYTWWFATEPGMITLFPSHFKHSVPYSEFEGERRSIAFDVILRPILKPKNTTTPTSFLDSLSPTPEVTVKPKSKSKKS